MKNDNRPALSLAASTSPQPPTRTAPGTKGTGADPLDGRRPNGVLRRLRAAAHLTLLPTAPQAPAAVEREVCGTPSPYLTGFVCVNDPHTDSYHYYAHTSRQETR